MKYIIDSHTFLWYSILDERISTELYALISDIENEIYLSVASVWELSIKYQLKKLELPVEPGIFIIEQMSKNEILPLEINLYHALEVSKLPYHHKDPFDRILVAQSLIENIPIITRDDKFKDYGVQVIW